MRRSRFCIFITVLSVWGCATIPDAFHEMTEIGPSQSIWFEKKSDALEKNDELQLSLKHLEIASQLDPLNIKLSQKISNRKDTILQKAKAHFRKGIIAYNNNQINEARKQFLVVLRYYPEHKAALDYVKHRIHPKNFFTYCIKKKDTPKTIAHDVYQDSKMDFLVAYLMGPQNHKNLKPGSILELPVLDKKWFQSMQNKSTEKIPSQVMLKTKEFETNLKLAKKQFNEGNYEEVVAITENMFQETTDNKEAQELHTSSCYHIGKKLIKKNQYIPAMTILKQVATDHPKVDKLKTELRIRMKKLSGIHYRRGVQYFVDEKLKKAIVEWKKTLSLDPKNKKAEKAIQNAKHLLNKLEGIE